MTLLLTHSLPCVLFGGTVIPPRVSRVISITLFRFVNLIFCSRAASTNLENVVNGHFLVNALQIRTSCFFIAENHAEFVDLDLVSCCCHCSYFYILLLIFTCDFFAICDFALLLLLLLLCFLLLN